MRNRVYLNVSFDEKDEAKALGAKWDPEDREWYFVERTQINFLKFSKWLKKEYDSPSINISSDVSIKIGKNIFSDLIYSIQNAKKRVYISSTYLGQGTSELLEEVQKKVANVKILFSIKENIIRDKNILKHFIGCRIKQDFTKKELNNKKIQELNKKISIERKMKICYIVFSMGVFISSFLYEINKFLLIGILGLLGMLILISHLLIRQREYAKTILEKEDFSYLSFFQKINHKAIIENYENSNLPHLKLYIIDDIAYIGSLNFSNSGCFFNIESLIEIRETDKVDELIKYFEELYDYYNEIDIHTIGSAIYNLTEEKFLQSKK